MEPISAHQKILPIALWAVGLLALSSCAVHPTGRRDPLALNQQWEATFNRGDAAGVAALYRSDARLYLPGSEPLVGTAAIRNAIASLIKTGVTVRVRPAEQRIASDLAYVVGSYTILNGQTEAEHGTFMEIWTRADDSWKILYDLNVPSAPLQKK